ncbi:glycosyltransferase [Mycolicibacterium baixiangningiae]|uniref:glycosyltransferase n=1 Tax=Mycolicibacterium baixiangningiae TaxID=2761578 RepID=UPI0018679E50|nr:glycosyltransferase [Mycolicibacterium baixiangningiae]
MAGNSIEIIIPVRNMASHLTKLLPPLMEQVTGDDVVTVINDASTDDTEKLARSHGADVVTLTGSRGPYYARQIVASRSTADILLFVDGRCRPLPGLLDAHRRLQAQPGVALSCTDVLTLSGPTLAARIAALVQPFRVPTRGAVPGKPPYYPTANLGVDKAAFDAVGGFRAMRSGGDSDICWRIQEEGLGTMAVDSRVLMHWEPRQSLSELASQWKRYGRGTAYLRWAYRMEDGPAPSLRQRAVSSVTPDLADLRAQLRKSPAQIIAGAAVNVMFQYGYHAEKRKTPEFAMPVTYDLTAG